MTELAASLGRWRRWAAVVLLAVGAALLAAAVDVPTLSATLARAAGEPSALALVLTAYLLAFATRAALWSHVLPSLPFPQALAAIHVSLAGNHLLPLRLGEALRVTSVVRRAGVPVAAATASTVSLRAADVLAVVGLGAVLGPHVLVGTLGPAGWLLAAPAAGVWLAGARWLRRAAAVRGMAVRGSEAVVCAGATLAWVLESAVVWQAAHWAGAPIGAPEAVLVTAVTIAAQVVAVAPGGLGTYEAAATAALAAAGVPAPAALAAAVTAHAVKTAYALVAGGVAAVAPTPSLAGRLRLATPATAGAAGTPDRDGAPAQGPDGPVVLFLPAHDEQAAVAGVVVRTPAQVLGRPVRVVVVDDGSTDATAAEASRAGADVVSLGHNMGLGAAVRRGLAEGLARGASAVAFCDADGEYAPEELERLVEPILRGRADYVVGSRFAGVIHRMRPHRRLGNRLLTSTLRFVARAPITDGQSGYRALSAAAAADARIVHDFNYAQVLTLELLEKGYRYAEAPISYRFRRHGRSFVRLGRYLRHVVPAVHRQLNGHGAVATLRTER